MGLQGPLGIVDDEIHKSRAVLLDPSNSQPHPSNTVRCITALHKDSAREGVMEGSGWKGSPLPTPMGSEAVSNATGMYDARFGE